MSILKKSYSILSKKERRELIYVLIISLLAAILESLSLIAIATFFAYLSDVGRVDGNYFINLIYQVLNGFDNSRDELTVVIGVLTFLFLLVTSGISFYSQFLINYFTEMRRHTIGKRLLCLYIKMPYEFFSTRHSGDLTKSILSEADQFVVQILRPILITSSRVFILFLLLTTLLLSNISFAVFICLFFLGIFGGAYWFVQSKLKKYGLERVEKNKERFITASDAILGIKEIKLFGVQDFFIERFSKPSFLFCKLRARATSLSQVMGDISEPIMFGTLLLIVIFFINKDYDSGESVKNILPSLTFYALVALKIKPAALAIYSGMTKLASNLSTVDVIYEDFLAKSSVKEHKPLHKIFSLKSNLGARNISFKYSSSDRPILQNINFQIPFGGFYAIVGSTGSGKSTLVNILLGLIKPTTGNVIVCDDILDNFDVRVLRENIGYVPQSIFLINGTVTENIAFGMSGDQIDADLVVQCSKMAHLHEFIVNELPLGYATRIGENGSNLSGGQRQRLGIARALYRKPNYLILDESTSALDPLTENKVMESLRAFIGQATLIVITHRYETLKNCDGIIFLDKGQLEAVDTYHNLLSNSPYFVEFITQVKDR